MKTFTSFAGRFRAAYPLPDGWRRWALYLLLAAEALIFAALMWDVATDAFWLALSLAGVQ